MAMLYFPAAQGVQSAVPVWSLYLPAVQAVQGPPSGPVKPALHVQSARVMLPAGEVMASGQLVQETPPLGSVVSGLTNNHAGKVLQFPPL